MVIESQILANSHNHPKPLSCPNSLCRQSVIMQNEPNFQKTKMNLTVCSERRYEKNHPSRLCENEPNRTQFSSSALEA